MKPLERICVGLIVATVTPLWAQVDNTQPLPVHAQTEPAATGADNSAGNSDGRMLTPPPVSGQTYPVEFTSEERSNYLRGGLSFTGAYSDNAVGQVVNGHPVSDESYSVAPMVALDQTTPRQHFLLTYAPGYTVYQHTSSRNEADQNASVEYEYRLSPHVTFSATDSFQKSSNVFNQSGLASIGTVSGGAQGANFSVIAPIADRLSNLGSASVTYQFSLNSMIGAGGTFSNLHYPNPAQVPGLFDSSSQGGLAFYSRRIAKKSYIGATYQYQRLLSYPKAGMNETQTHAVLFFYTLYPMSRFSISLFGGPQHSDTVQPLSLLPVRSWTPAAGASLGWQGRLNTFAISYAHIIASSGGLIGAVRMDSATASAGQRITKTLSGTLSGGYAQNDVLGNLASGVVNGHSISGTASVQQQLSQRLDVQLGYTRIHQSYSSVAVLSTTPNTNREFISLSYQFSKALGR